MKKINIRYYLIRLINTDRFWRAPISTLARGCNLMVLILFKRGKVVDVKFGGMKFKFNYVHGDRHEGGRGFFIFRDKIEQLMEYGDRFIKIGAVCIDGGANQGMYTAAFSKYVGSSGQVIAFEPMQYACEHIENNLNLNQVKNTTIVRKGLSDKTGKATLDLSKGVGSASITRDFSGAKTTEIETTTIDHTLELLGVKHVDFIKLDIEGAEFKALQGAQNTLNTSNPIICLEISGHKGEENEDRQAHNFLLALGYTAHTFEHGELVEPNPFSPPYMNVFYLPKNYQPTENLQTTNR